MKTSIALIPLSLALLSVGSPLGNRGVFRKHSGLPSVNRRFILQSRVDAPAACSANSNPVPTNTSSAPDLSSTAVPLANTTSSVDNTTANVNSTVSANATLADPTSTNNTTSTDNSTVSDNSTSLTNSTSSRRSTQLWSRFAQEDIPEVAQTWQDLCMSSGGDIITNDPCVFLAGLGGIDALQADSDTCAQQDIADTMITFAKSEGVTNSDALIAQAIAYRKHPRNAVNILGVVPGTLYCQKAPINPELSGVVNGQLSGVTPGLYGSPSIPIVPFGSDGTCPFGMTADVNSCSCSVDSSTNATDSTDGTTDGTDDSTGDTTDSSVDGSTDSTADDGTDDSTDDSSSTDVTSSDSASTDTATATDTASAATSTDTSDDSSDDTSAASTTTSGPNFQPTDISGNVNDPAGR